MTGGNPRGMSKIVAFHPRGSSRVACPTFGALALVPCEVEDFPAEPSRENQTPPRQAEVIAFPGAWDKPEETEAAPRCSPVCILKTRIRGSRKFSVFFSRTYVAPSLPLAAFLQVLAARAPPNLASGVSNASYRYSAYGEILSETESITHPNPYRYVSREFEHKTGLYDMKRRFYDPRLGRFISADPYLGSGYDPRTLHRYTYAFASPTRFWDPTGYVSAEFEDWSDAGTVMSMKILYPPATGYDPIERHAEWSYNTRIIGLEGTLRSFVRGADLYLDEAAASIYRLSGTEGGRQSATLIEADVNRRLDQLSPEERYVTERAKEGIDQFVFLGSVFFPFAWEGRAAGEVVNLTGRAATRSGYEIMQQLTSNAAGRLARNPGLAARYLSGGEYAAGQASARIANLQYGNAIERMVAADIRSSPELRQLFEHLSRPGKAVPDFVGHGPFEGMKFDITTAAQKAAHRKRLYGTGLNITTYERPLTFTTFPR